MMKNFIYLVSLSVALLSCSSKNKMLEGQWKVVKYDIPKLTDMIEEQVAHAPDSLKKDYREMLTNNVKQMRDEVLNSTFEFKKDKSFNIITKESTHHGTWDMNKEGTMLYSRDSNASYTDTFYIIKLNKKELEFKITNVEKVESTFGLEKLK
jgi:hypothetical protein